MKPRTKAVYLYMAMQKYFESDPKRWQKYWLAFKGLAYKNQTSWDYILDELQEVRKYQVDDED